MKKSFLFFALTVLFISCKDEKPIANKPDVIPNDTLVSPKDANGLEYSTINEWIYGTLSAYYYWNTTLPNYSSSLSEPTAYFKSLKNMDDRFSAIFDDYTEIANALNGVSAAEVGFEFQLFRESSKNNNVIGEVSYVKAGTPAKIAGIKRGSLFRKINGQQLNMTNYNTLLNYFYDSSASVSITFATVSNNMLYDSSPYTLTKAVNYNENPVYLDSVYTIQNKKIGYLIYNFFSNDNGDNSLSYDLALNNAFGKFKQQNVTELVVDLRYNHGGMMSSAVHLASMMVPNLTTNMVYAYTQYNTNFINYFNSAEFKNKYPNEHPLYTNFATTIDVSATQKIPVQNIGNSLQRIFFLTSTGTASASEMVINGLKPFLTCVLVGDTTVGKNVGSILINDDQNAKNKWAMMPIVLKYFNKEHKSDFSTGFVPDFRIDDDLEHQLGDVNEEQFAKAISQITGIATAPAAKARVLHRRAVKSSLDFKPIRNVMIVDKMRFSNLNYKLK